MHGEALKAMKQAPLVLVHSAQQPERVQATKEKGQKLGFTHEEIGKRISGASAG